MKSIGFKNFRRFQEMNTISLGGINIFVGGNNAGKSTVVKGLLLLLDFLKNQKVSSTNLFESPKFLFDGPEAHDVNIDTFGRALCWKSKEKEIVFHACIEEFEIEVCIYNNTPEEVGYADVKYIILEDQKTGLKFVFDVVKGKITVSESVSIEQKKAFEEKVEELEKELSELNAEISKMGTIEQGEKDENKVLDRVAQRSHLEATLVAYKKQLGSSEEEKIQLRLPSSPSIGYSYIYNYLQGLMDYIDASAKNKKLEKNELSPKELSWLLQHLSDINDVNTRFDRAVQKTSLEYVYAQNASQQVIYNKKDENDYVSKSIHEFYNQRISSESEIGNKMLSWLKNFCGVDDYRVETVQGVAYRFVLKFDGKWIDLADMGRGAIQLVTLCVRLASIVKKYKDKTDVPIVLVEEPEQNLHPAYQSYLLDLFYSIYKDYGIRFIIETHSEYLVRNLQIKAATILNDENFQVSLDEVNSQYVVYYFPQTGSPYSMVFLKNGRFENSFDNGFYDQTGSLNIQLIKAGKGE